VLCVYGKVQAPVVRINNTFFMFKLVALVFDFAGVLLAAYLLKLHRRNIALAFFILFNVAYVYNTLFWGQVDTIYSFFIALAVFLATRRKVELSLISLLVAINFKLIGLAFAPLIVLLNVPEIRQNKHSLLRAVVIGLVLQTLILLPFLSRSALTGLWVAIQGQLRGASTLSPSGDTFWNLVEGNHAPFIPAETKFLGVTKNAWGIGLFFASVGVMLAPLFKTTVLEKKRLSDAYVYLASALYGVAFFFFKTGMHERYSHPVLLLSGIYAVLSGRYFVYLLTSVAYFLTLEKGYPYFALHSYETLIFRREFGAALFLGALLVGTFTMYRNARSSAYAPV